MRNTKILAWAVTLLPMLASAQQAVITFDTLEQSVPLGPWLPALSAAALAVAAFFLYQRKGAVMRSLVLVGGATFVALFALQHQTVNADAAVFAITLSTSPSQTDITANIGVATNATGRQIRITNVSIDQAQSSSSSLSCPLAIVAATTTCTAGTTLAPSSTCQIEVSCPT